MEGGAGAGRALLNLRFGDLVVKLLLTFLLRWFNETLSAVPRNLALRYCLWFDDFFLMAFLEHAKHFLHLRLLHSSPILSLCFIWIVTVLESILVQLNCTW